MVAHVWYQSHRIISVSPALVLQLYFKKLFCSEIKLALIAALESGQNTSVDSSGASPGATERGAALVTALLLQL